MFEFDQDTVNELLSDNEQFRRLYDKHHDLNTRVDEVTSGNATMEQLELEAMKKEKAHAPRSNAGHHHGAQQAPLTPDITEFDLISLQRTTSP